jgi:hypothetical protein
MKLPFQLLKTHKSKILFVGFGLWVFFIFINLSILNKRIDSINDRLDLINQQYQDELDNHSSRLNVLEMDDTVAKSMK